MNTTTITQNLSFPARSRIALAGVRYDFWLDLYSVPRSRRRSMRTELRSNLTDATHAIGVGPALVNLGSLRRLASEATRDGQLRSHWIAGWMGAVATFAVLLVTFFFVTLYWSEGALDAGATEPIRSSLLPYFGSNVAFDPTNGGLAWSMEPGPMPLVVALVVWLLIARPWRSVTSRTAT